MPDWVMVGLEAGDSAHRFNTIAYKGPDGLEAQAAYVACISIATDGSKALIFKDARAYKTPIPIPS